MLNDTFKPFMMSVIRLIVVMLSVVMLNVVVLRVVMLSVAAPLRIIVRMIIRMIVRMIVRIIVRMIVRSFVEFQPVFKQTNKKGFHSMRNFGHIFSRPKNFKFQNFFFCKMTLKLKMEVFCIKMEVFCVKNLSQW